MKFASTFFVIMPVVTVINLNAAFADDNDVLQPLSLSANCESAIFHKAEALCNKETRSNPDREHDCAFWGQVSIKRNGAEGAYFEADFTIADAEVFTYGVSIENKANCLFSVVSRN